MLKNALSGKKIEIWGDGNTVRDYIYIDDVCNMTEALVSYSGEHDTFNISSGKGYSQKEIIEFLKDLKLDFEVEYQSARSIDVKRIILDNSRIKELGEFNILDLFSGIKKYYDYLLNL